MAGLQILCKMYGRMKIGAEMYRWDFVADKARPEKEMTQAEIMASEKKRWTDLKDSLSGGNKQS